MAVLNRRVVLLLLLAICLVSVTMRYPLVEHERHNDTYFMSYLAGSIVEEERAGWTFHPLSYFGYYPASYPSGEPFLLAEFSQMTGLNFGTSILIEGMVIGVLFVLVVFCLSREFIHRSQFVLLATFVASLGPRFIDTSYWNGSARAIFVVLAVLVVFFAFRASYGQRFRIYALLVPVLVGCFALHHMAVLFVPIGLTYILSVVGSLWASRMTRARNNPRLRKWLAASFLLSLGLTIGLVAIFELSYFSFSLTYEFSETSLFSIDPPFLSIALNLAASYVNQIGFILVFAVVGIPSLVRSKTFTTKTLFLLVLPLVFLPLLPSSLYLSLLLLPFIAVLGAMWFSTILKKRNALVSSVLVVLVLSCLALPVWSIDRWNNVRHDSGDLVVGDHQLVNDAAYLGEFSRPANAITNDEIMGGKLSGLSGMTFLYSDIAAALIGDLTAERIRDNLTWMNERFPQNLYLWFDYEGGYGPEHYSLRLVMNGIKYHDRGDDSIDSGEQYFGVHNKLVVAVDNHWRNNYIWAWGILPATLPNELRDAQWKNYVDNGGIVVNSLSSYCIYESERTTMYALEVP